MHLLLANRVKLELDRGRWDAAVDSADRLLCDPDPHAGPRLQPLVAIALVRARSGDPGVWELLDEALTLSEPTGEASVHRAGGRGARGGVVVAG